MGAQAADSAKLGGATAASYALQSWVTTQLGSYLTTATAATTYQPIDAEGIWTPTPAGLSGSGITYAAKWIKSGNRVDFTITVSGTGLGSSYGSTTLSIPFTPGRASAVMTETSAGASVGGHVNTSGYINLPTFSGLTFFIVSGIIFLD